MRSRLAAFLLVAAQTSASAQQPIHTLDGRTLTAQQASTIADAELRNNNVMGATLAILNHGHVVWTHTYGLRDAAQNLPMTPDTNLWAASITKAAFATWIMHLVEQHQFNLDEPIAHQLRQPLDTYAPYRDIASDLVHDPRWQLVTPRMMLSHTSGLANFSAFEPDKKMHLHFTPGTQFAYSGDGLHILQLVLEERFHQPLDVMMQRDLFTPLHMTRTGLVWHDDFASDAALRYDANGHLIGATHRTTANAAGSMATTLNDLTRFTEALLAHKILSPSVQQQMFSPQIRINAAHQFPTLRTDTSTEGPQVGLAYGLGWGLLTHTRFGPAFFKEGHGDGAENYLICFTRSNNCMILLTNSDNGELAFQPLLEQLFGDTVTPWEWESYTHEAILHNEEHSSPK